ncbi:MAG TPA: class I SAM-dependent methyltransferase [Chryseolinea sp.]|nr:class I SAM-dependent methyltransferase [Chryseolinea sp.]
MLLKDKLLANASLEFDGRLFHQKSASIFSEFQEPYIRIREKEGRLYEDEVVRNLPLFPPQREKNNEWRTRAFSTAMITRYLGSRRNLHAVMELGCGSGWLSDNLAKTLSAEVCGIDINILELKQGARLFSRPNLLFVNGDVMSLDLPACFDVIILAGSIQYFPNVGKLMDRLFAFLHEGGEIHVLDSPIYKSRTDGDRAKERSRKYFESFGVPEMHVHYFHHSFDDFNNYQLRVASDPSSILSKIKRKVSGMAGPIFPLVIVTKAA